jgi:hypothetical protein
LENSIKDGTKEDPWLQLCQQTHVLQKKLQPHVKKCECESEF